MHIRRPSEEPSSHEIDRTVYTSRRFAKGEFIDAGVSGIVELLPNGHVTKSAWPIEHGGECREDLAREARAYQRLSDRFGPHQRFVPILSHDAAEWTLTMEDMTNGTLRAYLELHHEAVGPAQRHRWIEASAEGMEMLHAADIVHCDFSPRNMLLDRDLELKVADFGCVAMNGSESSAGGSVRSYPPRAGRDDGLFDVNDDLFALGSSIYEGLTGKPPYVDVETRPIQNLHRLRQFPDLAGLEMSGVIRDCWLLRAHSAREVRQRIQATVWS